MMLIDRSRFRAILMLGLLSAVGCGAAESDSQGYQVVDSAGIRIVESSEPVWNDPTVRIEETPLVRIGREEEGSYQFGIVMMGQLLGDSLLAVSEAADQEIRVFDWSGEHVATLGGSGEGPGEFRGLAHVFGLGADSIAAFDGRLRRTTVFSIASGEHRTIPNEVEGNYVVFGVTEGGRFLLYSPGGSYRPDLEPGLQWVSTDVVAMEREGRGSRVIATLPDRWRDVGTDGNAPMPEPLLYAVQAVSASGFYWATPDQYEIQWYDLEGNLRRILRRPVMPGEVTDSLRSAWIQIRLDQVRRFEGESAVSSRRRELEERQLGERLPLFQAAFVDRNDRLWIGSSEWPSSRASRVWDLFGSDGRWLSEVEAPEGLSVVDAEDDIVLGIWRDSFEVPHIQLNRLAIPEN